MSNSDKKAVFLLAILTTMTNRSGLLESDIYLEAKSTLSETIQIYAEQNKNQLMNKKDEDLFNTKLIILFNQLEKYEITTDFIFDLYILSSEYFLQYIKNEEKITQWNKIKDLGNKFITNDKVSSAKSWFCAIAELLSPNGK